MKLTKIRSGALSRFRKRSTQKTVGFNLTNKCNYHCEYCIQDQQDFQVSHLPRVFVNKIIDACALHNGVTALNFSGGEPTLYPDFFDLVAYARSKGSWDIQCTTNAWQGVPYFKKIRNIDDSIKHGVSIHFAEYNPNTIFDCIDELSLFRKEQSLLILYGPGKIEETSRIIEYAKLTHNVKFKIIPIFSSADSKLFYQYSKEEEDFFNEQMKNELLCNFADFMDAQGKIYRLFGSVYSVKQDNNIFRHYKGMQCTTCSIANKVRQEKIWPLLCDFDRFEENVDPDSFFKHAHLPCRTEFCVCNGHTLHPKFSDIRFAPVYMGGDPAFDVDCVVTQQISNSDIMFTLKGGIPSYSLIC